MIIDDLYRHNSWANHRIFALCEGLSDAQLDEKREIGFGSLRNTMFHILTAEEIWFERWTGVPWRPFPTDAGGLPMRDIAQRLDRIAEARQQLIDRVRTDGWQRVCEYKDSKGNPYRNRLDGLLLHLANHGTHHRAQALHFLKHSGRTIPGGLDFLFYRLAKPYVPQEPAVAAAFRQRGLEVATGSGSAIPWNGPAIRNYFAYGDWCNDRLLPLAAKLDDAALDRDFGMGMGTIRKTALHIADAERWWLSNWTIGPTPFDKAPFTTPVADLREQWKTTIAKRDSFLESVDGVSAQRVVTAQIGPLSLRMPVIDSMVQLGTHGTHHRAQLLNMLRHSGVIAPGIDYVVWIRETNAE